MTASTPILDRQQAPPPAKSLKNARVIGLAVGLLIGLALDFWMVNAVRTDASSLLIIPWFLLAWQVTIAIHESGHLLAGWLAGFTIRGAVICCYRLMRTREGWRFTLEWKRLISGGLAYVLSSGPEDSDWRYGAMVAAGPLASVLWFAVLLWIPWPEGMEGARRPALFAAGIVAAIAVLPITAGGTLSDMARLLTLARGGDNWLRWKLLLRYQALDAQCVPPREWDPEGLDRAAALSGGRPIEQLACTQYAHLAAADRADPAEAARHVESMLALSGGIGPVWRAATFFTAAGFHAWTKNAALARSWLDQAGTGKGLPKYCRWSAEAEVLLAEGHIDAAREKAEFALTLLRRVAHQSAITDMAIRGMQEILGAPEKRSGATN